jgi:hypothetical protein
MVSIAQINTTPIGMFAGGTSLSGGAADPTITENFGQSRSNEVANYPDGLPGTFTTTPGSMLSHGISAVAINASTFKSKVSGQGGTYTFVSYMSESATLWKLTSPTAKNNINLTEYGISLSGEPTISESGDGEGFVVEYVQGNDASDYSVTVKEITRIIITQNVGKKFLIGDFNLIGYLGTLQQYRRQMGGIRTYDPAFAQVIGGYPKGSQLEYLQVFDGATQVSTRSEGFRFLPSYDYKLRKVLSLIDDNANDFVADPSCIDNIRWMYCDVVEQDTPTLPSSVMTPQIVCWVNLYYVNTSTLRRTFSATLNQDSYLTASIGPYMQFSQAYLTEKVNVYTILNGNTKDFAHYTQYGNNNVAAVYNGNGSIVKAGTTVRVEIEYEIQTSSFIPFVEVNVCVIAVPVNKGNSIQRI